MGGIVDECAKPYRTCCTLWKQDVYTTATRAARGYIEPYEHAPCCLRRICRISVHDASDKSIVWHRVYVGDGCCLQYDSSRRVYFSRREVRCLISEYILCHGRRLKSNHHSNHGFKVSLPELYILHIARSRKGLSFLASK